MSSPLDEMKVITRIRPSSAHSFQLKAGDQLLVIDPQGQQVADLVAFSTPDFHECISSGRSFDYASRIWLSTGDILYSNRSKSMLTILEDTCGRHDFMLAACSKDTLSIGFDETGSRLGCVAQSNNFSYKPIDFRIKQAANFSPMISAEV